MHVLTLIFILFIFKYYIFFLACIFGFFSVFVCYFSVFCFLFAFSFVFWVCFCLGDFSREEWFCISLCSTEQPYTSNMRTFSIHYLRALGPLQRKSPFINYHVTLYKFTIKIYMRASVT